MRGEGKGDWGKERKIRGQGERGIREGIKDLDPIKFRKKMTPMA